MPSQLYLHCLYLQDILADGSKSPWLQIPETLQGINESKVITQFSVVDEDKGIEGYKFSLHDTSDLFQMSDTTGVFQVNK